MADITKATLKKEIAAILKDADLLTTSAKKVREEIEAKLDCDLASRKKEIDGLVIQYLKENKGKGSKNGKADSDEEEEDGGDEGADEDEVEEEEDASEEEEKPKRAAKKSTPKRKKGSSDESEDDNEKDSGDEYSPAKKAKGKARAKKGKKKGSDEDSDEDTGKAKKAKKGGGGGKRGGGGFTKLCTLTPELAAVVGSDTMARPEVVKKVWALIKEKNLYDPKNKQFAICNDELYKVFGVKRFRTFGMMKYLKDHFVS